MGTNVRAFPQVLPPQPQQQDWVWNGTSWVDPCCNPAPMPPPCPPSGWPTPCPPWFPPPAGQAPWYPGANGGVSFSATPPANPIRGNFWWDGTMLHLFDGAAWVNIGPGASGGGSGGAFVGTTPPSNPAIGALWWNGTTLSVWDGTQWAAAQSTTQVFGITVPANLTLTAGGVWTIVPFTASPTIDIQNGYNAASHQYTPKVPGTYACFARGSFQVSGAGSAGVAIAKNDPGSFAGNSTDTVVAVGSRYDATAISDWITAGGFVPMNGTTDYLRMFARSTSGVLYPAGVNYVFGIWKMP